MKTNNALLQLYLFIIAELLTLETDCNKDNTGLNVKEEKINHLLCDMRWIFKKGFFLAEMPAFNVTSCLFPCLQMWVKDNDALRMKACLFSLKWCHTEKGNAFVDWATALSMWAVFVKTLSNVPRLLWCLLLDWMTEIWRIETYWQFNYLFI